MIFANSDYDNSSPSTLVVLKFGGASLATPQQFDTIADIIINRMKTVDKLIVVVSAMGTTTDKLIALAHSVHSTPPQREYDMLLSTGERMSMSLLAMALEKKGVHALSLTGSQSGIITCSTHTDAKIVEIRPKRIIAALDKGHIVIVAGFQGVSRQGEITTLGRGGSDTSAVALGVALDAQVVEFYKDVPGFFSKDPKLFSDARFFPTLSYDMALSILRQNNSSRILHPRSIEMAQRHNIPLRVLSFNNDCIQKSKFPTSGSIIYDPKKERPLYKLYENAENTGQEQVKSIIYENITQVADSSYIHRNAVYLLLWEIVSLMSSSTHVSFCRLLYVAFFAWLSVGVLLLHRGIHLLLDSVHTISKIPAFDESVLAMSALYSKITTVVGDPTVTSLLYLVVGIAIGMLKSRAIFRKVVSNNVARIFSLPEKRTFFQAFGKKDYITMFAMMGLGAILKKAEITNDIRGLLLVAVGSALLRGATFYYHAIRKCK